MTMGNCEVQDIKPVRQQAQHIYAKRKTNIYIELNFLNLDDLIF